MGFVQQQPKKKQIMGIQISQVGLLGLSTERVFKFSSCMVLIWALYYTLVPLSHIVHVTKSKSNLP